MHVYCKSKGSARQHNKYEYKQLKSAQSCPHLIQSFKPKMPSVQLSATKDRSDWLSRAISLQATDLMR